MVLQGGSVLAALHPEEFGRFSWGLLAVLGSCSKVFHGCTLLSRSRTAALRQSLGWAQGWGPAQWGFSFQ